MSRPQNYPINPKHLWEQFFLISQVPRPSKAEEKILEHLVNIAKSQNLEYKQDRVGNLVIYLPGKGKSASRSPIVIQNHVDMVTDAISGKTFDFLNDSIELCVEDDWLTANGTTLGADNGIGCAAALAVIFEEGIEHPPLELLFTVDEETGLNGALNLSSQLLTGKKMLNLDTEEWGSIYTGCAGGIDYELTKDFEAIDLPAGWEQIRVDISGFVGGHSGVDIHEQRGNAIKFLGQFLHRLSLESELLLGEIRGGRAHNIIPREAFVVFAAPSSVLSRIELFLEKLRQEWIGYLTAKDQQINYLIETNVDKVGSYLSSSLSTEVINLVNLFPHGVLSYQDTTQNLVSCSNNFARLLLVKGKLYIQSSLRFFDRNEVKVLEEKLKILGELFQLKIETHSEYPSWKPNSNSELLQTAKNVYKSTFAEEPIVTAIHAGLECGIIRDKMGDVDVISFGPTITGAHSPDERIYIPSVTQFWRFFKELLKEI